jgi:hypothetical protein
MVEQLFTAASEEKGNGQERREQLFTAKREKRDNGEADGEREETEMERSGAISGSSLSLSTSIPAT